MRDLIEKINQATKLYDEGRPSMTDEEWDNLYFQLLDLEQETGLIYPDSPTQKISYDIVNKLQKVEHNHPMLSLDKTKSVDEVNSFLGNHDYVAMAKMDGLTCSLRYVDGKLVSAETRGNGVIGEDVLHNAKVISSIPKYITYHSELVVDGEIVCLDKDFDAFSSEYKNSRNFAAGSIRLLDAQECAGRKLSFIAWEMIKGYEDENSFSQRLDILNSLGFLIVPWIKENVFYAIGDMQDYCKNHGYPIDGVVFKFDDVAFGKSLGATNHHARNAIAYKFYDEEYETRLFNIEWGMGRTGVLTPVAVFEPIDMDGSIVERASLHNINIMQELLGKTPFQGENIWVIKSNMIIPQITRANTVHDVPVEYFEIPKTCPICGEPTIIKTSESGTEELYCTNPQCSGLLVNQLEHFFGKKGLDCKGLSEATFEKLIDWGWIENIIDVYSLADFEKDWCHKPGFGEKSVSNILNNIEAAKKTTLDKFICAIGIPLIGTSMSKILSKEFKTWIDFRNAVETNYDFTQLEDFGLTTDEAIKSFDYSKADQLAKLLIIAPIEEEQTSNSLLVGKKVVITGGLHKYKNRAELQQVIEQAGGKVVSSVSKNTDILINNDIASTSAKNMSAKKLNIPIMTEEDFVAEYIET